MQWYKINEKSAGRKRLLVSFWIYKLLGSFSLKIIAFFVALVTYILNKDIRKYSKKYFKVLFEYTNDKKLKPSNLNSFKHVLSFAFSLVDKMESFLGRLSPKNIEFANKKDKENLLKDMKEKGIFFICNHVGNIDVMRTLFLNNFKESKIDVSLFLQKDHCKIFNDFLNNIKMNNNKIKIYPIEDIDLASADKLDDSLKNGGVTFMAGDRIAANNEKKSLECSFLNKSIILPLGAFRFASLMNSNIYFISCVKEKNKYKIHVEKTLAKDTTLMQTQFINFLTKITLLYPYQFYNFYDIFKE